jgi:hypothetical protein
MVLMVAGMAGGVVGGAEMFSQRQAIGRLEKENKSLRMDLTNEVWERCMTDNMVYFHEFVLRKMNGVPTDYPPEIDCDAAYPPEKRGVEPTPVPRNDGRRAEK